MNKLKFGVALAALAAGSLLAVPQASAHGDGGGRGKGLAGVWLVKLSPMDCTTGVVFPVPPFVNLFTFHDDGSLAASMQNYAVSGTNRSLSHGLWQQKGPGKRGEYLMRFTHLRYDFISGYYLGTQQALSQVTLSPSGNAFTALSSTKGFDVNGSEEYTGCGKLTGERMQAP